MGGCADAASGVDPESEPMPDPARSGIEHVVVFTMESRSFDHVLGWLPDAESRHRSHVVAWSDSCSTTTARS